VADFLQGYGVSDARRERFLIRALLGAAALAVLGVVLYFSFRNWREDRRFDAFLDFLGKQDYQSAYRLWGCDPAQPCRDYNMDRFLEDWGPKSPQAAIAQAKVVNSRTCGPGVIKTLQVGQSDPVYLWVDKKDQIISYAPWNDSCSTPPVQIR
jgi:hypothetical protein